MSRRMFVLQLGLAVGPLLGWALADLDGFSASPARLGVVLVAILSCGLVARQPTPSDPLAKGVQGPSQARSLLLILGIVAVPVMLGGFAYADRRELLVASDTTGIRYAGLLLYALGETVRVAALRALGRQYSAYVTIQRDHMLVRSGIYRLVRHPIYLAQTLAVPGMALAFRSLLTGPLLLVSVLFISKRITREEALLKHAFPVEFDEYRQETWRLLPFVY